MSFFLDMSAALDGRLNTMSGLPAVSWENKKFTPAVGTIYIRPTILTGDSVPQTVGSAGRDLNIGVYQIDVFGEAGQGKNEVITMADTIADHFKHGTQMTYNGSTVEVKTVSQRQAVNNDDGWYQAIVEIVYYSFTARR